MSDPKASGEWDADKLRKILNLKDGEHKSKVWHKK